MPLLSTSKLPSAAAIDAAVTALTAGQLVAIPTETVYGLAGDACNEQAIAAIFARKGRPSHNPLIVHVADLAMAARYAIITPLAEKMAATYWPGPLTLVLPKQPDCLIADAVSAGGDTLAVRAPAHPIAQALLRAFDSGLAAPSANPSGRISPTTAHHVARYFPDDSLPILDGGACAVGIESTVVDCTGDEPVVLRPGTLLADELTTPDASSGGTLRSPGLLSSHYAPHLPVRLNATDVAGNEALLAFGSSPLSGAATCLNLSASGDLQEAARHLFANLHQLDKPGTYRAIAVMPIPQTGIGIAINDRLRRAASPR